jgi:hypothetical protein
LKKGENMKTTKTVNPAEYKINLYGEMSENWRHLSAKKLRELHEKQGRHPVYELRPDHVVIDKQKI